MLWKGVKLAALSLAVVLIVLAPKVTAPPAVKHFPQLNAATADAWILPIADTQALGRYSATQARWSITVIRGVVGTDTSDDFCTRVSLGIAQLADRPFSALFLLAVHNEGPKTFGVKDTAFSLVGDNSDSYPARWFGPTLLLVGDSLFVTPQHAAKEYIFFDNLPRDSGSYTLQLQLPSGTRASIAKYRIIPNYHNPCA